MCLCWSLGTLYIQAYQVRVTVGDSGLCCCAYVFWVPVNSLVGCFALVHWLSFLFHCLLSQWSVFCSCLKNIWYCERSTRCCRQMQVVKMRSRSDSQLQPSSYSRKCSSLLLTLPLLRRFCCVWATVFWLGTLMCGIVWSKGVPPQHCVEMGLE